VPYPEPSSCPKRPDDVNARRENTKVCCIIASDSSEHVVRKYACIEELENPMFHSFNGGNVARQISQRRAYFLARLTKQPPITCIGLRIFASRPGSFFFAV